MPAGLWRGVAVFTGDGCVHRPSGGGNGEQAPGGSAAAALVSHGSTVILGGGTTALAVTAALPQDLYARIVTPSPATAAALVDHPTIDVFMLGGRLLKQSASVCGAVTAEAAIRISADIYLLGVAGVHGKEGFTTGDPDEAAMERILVGRAADTYVLASAEKLGTVAPYNVVGASGGRDNNRRRAGRTRPSASFRTRELQVIHAG